MVDSYSSPSICRSVPLTRDDCVRRPEAGVGGPSRHATPHEASSNIIRPVRLRFAVVSRNGARNCLLEKWRR
jgi:hypothetical protein